MKEQYSNFNLKNSLSHFHSLILLDNLLTFLKILFYFISFYLFLCYFRERERERAHKPGEGQRGEEEFWCGAQSHDPGFMT